MESRKDNTIVIIPSYNEGRTIGQVVTEIVDMGLNVLVVDDGSNDNTERVALDSGAMVIRSRYNRGKGFSIREGINYVLDKTKFEWIIIMDGDGQHHAGDIHAMMEVTHTEDVDIVNGNRMLQTESMPAVRYWTNKFMSWMISGICRQNIPDTQCGYRLVRVDALKKLKLTSKKYDIETEMLIKAADSHMKISSVPVKTIYGEEKSKIRPIHDTIRFFALILKYHFNLGWITQNKEK